MNLAAFRCSAPSADELVPRVARQVGYPAVDGVSPKIRAEIEAVTGWAVQRVRPEGRYRVEGLAGCGQGRLWSGGLQVRSARWARLAGELPEPRMIAGFVLTVGAALEDRVRRDQGESLFSAYLLDAAGSVIVEWAADRMEEHIAGILRDQGLEATGRFSPGYCDWEILDGQRSVFGWLCPGSLGVRCTPSGMMSPRKSVSACMLGAPRVARRYPCAFCPRADCEYRREAAGGEQPGGRCCP